MKTRVLIVPSALLESAQSGTTSAIRQVINLCHAMVKSIADNLLFSPRMRSFADEFYCFGDEVVWDCICRYDHRGDFVGFTAQRVRQRLLDKINSENHAHELFDAISLDEPIRRDENGDGLTRLDLITDCCDVCEHLYREERERVTDEFIRRHFSGNDKKAEMVRLHLNVHPDADMLAEMQSLYTPMENGGFSIDNIAEYFGCTPQYVGRIVHRDVRLALEEDPEMQDYISAA